MRRLIAMLALLLGLLPAFTPAWADDGQAQIVHVHSEVREQTLFADINLRIRLSPTQKEALHNGVILSLRLETEIQRPRTLLWAASVAESRRHFRLEYHALSETYLVHDELERETWTFGSLASALEAIGQVRAWPVARADELEDEGRLLGRSRMRLDVHRLPLPLRLTALTQDDWALQSEWFLWEPATARRALAPVPDLLGMDIRPC